MVRDLVGLAVAIAVVLDADQLAIGAPDGSVGASCEENVLAAVLAGDGGDVGGGGAASSPPQDMKVVNVRASVPRCGILRRRAI